jgi:hypothetical protein
MRYYFFSSIFFMLSAPPLLAQFQEPCGARAAGMGNAVVTISDEWAPFHNIAGIATQKRLVAGLWYKNDYAVRAFQETSVHVVGTLLKGGFAASFYKFGNELYNVNRISAGYAHKISLVRLGIQVHYVQAAMENLGVRKNVVLDFGGITELVPTKLFFGANIFNLNQATLNGELLPVLMKAGLSYRPGKKVMLNAEVEKDVLYKPTVKAGLEYAVLEKFSVRTGINTRPFINFFGLGFQNKIFQLDYALTKHSQLGYSHRISILIFFNKLK